MHSPHHLKGLSPAISPAHSMDALDVTKLQHKIMATKTFSKDDPVKGASLPSSVPHEVLSDVAASLLKEVREKLPNFSPRFGVILGSGLGNFAHRIAKSVQIPYEDIPYFPVSTVVGHSGRLIFGELGGEHVVCMKGRVHQYEGYPAQTITIPVRLLKLLGVDTLFVTNAAGGLNSAYSVGDFMVIKDHINMPQFAGHSPLVGKNDDKFGPRFPPMNKAYDKYIRQLAHEEAKNLGFGFVREGVYLCQTGPCYETVAELRMFKALGVDCIGMSTAPEVVVAKHCGLRVFGMSLVTNACITEFDDESQPNHQEVLEIALKRASNMEDLFERIITRLAKEEAPNGKDGNANATA